MTTKTTTKTYLLLFRGGANPADMTPEQMKTTMNNWMAWMSQLKKNKQLKLGHPLEDGGKILSGIKGKDAVSFEDNKDTIGGFLVINAKNLTEATKIAKGCPIFNNGGTVELRQGAEMP
jgi:hypothetical protein